MRVAVANSDFTVGFMDKNTEVIRVYQVANGEDLKTISKRLTGVVSLQGVLRDGGSIAGYLVEIEGETVFIDENLMEVSK